ncbi:MAG: metal ABC transporter permease [Alistipes sp.]|nr:metal ABC transporter permease [Alistipes sp.]
MEFFIDIMQYQYLMNAFLAAILSGIMCGIVGTYIVSRRMVFLCGGITHSSFGGLGIAVYYGANPLFGALIFAIASALGIEWASRNRVIREDSAIGIIWSVGMAVGALFLNLTPGYTSGDLTSYMFGSIITVTNQEVVVLAIFTFVCVIGFATWWRPIIFLAFDHDYAASQGVSTRYILYFLSAIVAIAIVLAIRIMGIVLLLSLFTIPCVAANYLTKSYRNITLTASLMATIGTVTGLVISYNLEVPPGTCIIFTLLIMLFVAKILSLRNIKNAIKE